MLKRIFFGLFLVAGFCLAQDQVVLMDQLKALNRQMDALQNGKASLKKVGDIGSVRHQIFEVKSQLGEYGDDLDNVLYSRHDISLDYRTELIDFYLYNHSDSYYQAFARIRNVSSYYLDYVKLRCNFYKDGSFTGTDYSYIDFESAGSTGMSPYQYSFLQTYFDKVDFDSVAFEVDYNSSWSEEHILWDQILILNSSVVSPYGSSHKWQGQVKNDYNYSMTYPAIYACIYRDGHMLSCDYTYLDVPDNTMAPNSTGTFDSYMDLPSEYDEIKYYLSYALYSLDGTGNLPPNKPLCISDSITGETRVETSIDLYLDDPNSDRVNLIADFGDGTVVNLIEGYSSKTSVQHAYNETGVYQVSFKGYDDGGLETEVSDFCTVTVSRGSSPVIVTASLDTLLYGGSTSITLQAEGGYPPYTWAVDAGVLPPGLILASEAGVLSGRPEQSGDYAFTVSVTDGGLPPISDSMAYSLHVLNHCPTITSADSIRAVAGAHVEYHPEAADPDGNPLTLAFINCPDWLQFVNESLSGTAPDSAVTAQFDLIASDGDMADTLAVTVIVTEVLAPDIALSHDAFDYGDVFCDSTLAQAFTITNNGNADLTVSNIALTGDAEFTMPIAVTGLVLSPEAECRFEVMFIPAIPREYSSELIFYSDDPEDSTIVVNLLGTGMANSSVVDVNVPGEFRLVGNYPNPFNPSTTILMEMPFPGRVVVEVLNLQGQVVETVTDKQLGAGGQSLRWNAVGCPSGTYFIRMRAGSFCEVKKCVLLR